MTLPDSPIEILLSMLSLKKGIPKDIRLFIPTEKKFHFYDKGTLSATFTQHGLMSEIKQDRGSILDAFSKFEFVIFEMLRFTVVGFEPTDAIEEVNNALSFRQRINVLTKLKILDKKLGAKIHNITDVRNSLAHKFKVNETIWNNERLFEKNNFDNFKQELQKTWNELIAEYNKMISESDINSVIKKIEDYNKS